MTKRRAVVLLSGGLDSSTVLGIARSEGFETFALSVQYGQRHSVELRAAKKVAAALQATDHRVMDVDLRGLGKSALTDGIEVPLDRTCEEMDSGIPVTYVPARNTILLSCALAYAESLSAYDIFIGVNAQDHTGYPDCRPEYIAAFEDLANVATQQAVESTQRIRIHTPLIHMTKSEIIERGLDLGVNFAFSSTCYHPSDDGHACGRCDACTLRLQGFEQVGVKDPIVYQTADGVA